MLKLQAFQHIDPREAHAFFQCMASENGFTNPFYGMDFDAFKQHIPEILEESKGMNLREGRVPQTLYFLMNDETIVGLFKVRHRLNDALRSFGGHVGFFIKKEPPCQFLF